MSEVSPAMPEGPFEGSRCLANVDGRWAPATIRRVNEDATFSVEFDEKSMILMPYWFGVMPLEISFNDADQWPAVFIRICPDGKDFDADDFFNAITQFGYQHGPNNARKLWIDACVELFDVSAADAESLSLKLESCYELFLHFGIAAKHFERKFIPRTSPPYFPLYWNQTRMGGREPSEVVRGVTLDDALAAIGIATSPVDQVTIDLLEAFEKAETVRLPTSLKTLLGKSKSSEMICNSHPNNPRPIAIAGWDFMREMREHKLDGEFAIFIMEGHSGGHEWAVVWNEGDDEARVYLHSNDDENETWVLTAPTIAMFFWDLAQTGLSWHQHTRFKSPRPVRRSDIGLVLAVDPDPSRPWWRFGL